MSKKERKDRQAKVEELEKDLEKEKENLGIEESPLMRKESKVAVSTAAARRARALLWAHLLHFEVDAEAKKGECTGCRGNGGLFW
jgi:translocation protein SEC63